jgi:hypothetical protein
MLEFANCVPCLVRRHECWVPRKRRLGRRRDAVNWALCAAEYRKRLQLCPNSEIIPPDHDTSRFAGAGLTANLYCQILAHNISAGKNREDTYCAPCMSPTSVSSFLPNSLWENNSPTEIRPKIWGSARGISTRQSLCRDPQHYITAPSPGCFIRNPCPPRCLPRLIPVFQPQPPHLRIRIHPLNRVNSQAPGRFTTRFLDGCSSSHRSDKGRQISSHSQRVFAGEALQGDVHGHSM